MTASRRAVLPSMKLNVTRVAVAATVGFGTLVAISGPGLSQQGLERAKAQCREEFRAVAKKAGHDPKETIRQCVIAKMRAAKTRDEKSKTKFISQCRTQYRSPAGVPNAKAFMQKCVRGKLMGKGGKS